MDLIFATHNIHKFNEIQNILGEKCTLLSLKTLQFYDDIPETQATIEANALEKARFIYNLFERPCFADDTGLEVESLFGEPGVHSARYAGNTKDFEANIDKLLSKLEGIKNRNARFRTVIALIIDNREYLFEGEVKGEIMIHRSGDQGFGYDSVFKPVGFNKTFAEMNIYDKNEISHRALALHKLIEFLDHKSL
jgi:XTP/dITP diphosphohydrolase